MTWIIVPVAAFCALWALAEREQRIAIEERAARDSARIRWLERRVRPDARTVVPLLFGSVRIDGDVQPLMDSGDIGWRR